MPSRSAAVESADMKRDGLEAIYTIGDGNCFFAAISDQLHGNFEHATEYRALSVQHIKLNKEKYIDFMVINEGGGIRRQPKRKNAGGYSISVDHGAPTVEARELQFKNELKHMGHSGTFADEIQIRALAEALQINIRIYETDFTRDIDGAPGMDIQIATIAYNRRGEHYQSVRKIGTRKAGVPQLNMRIAEATESIEPQSPIRPVSAPGGHLLPEQLTRSRSSTPGSVSIERDHDEDDDDEPIQPAKRNTRARITRSVKSRKPSSLSKRISAAPTPTSLGSRAVSPAPTIQVDAAVNDTIAKDKVDLQENTPPSTSVAQSESSRATSLPSPRAKSPLSPRATSPPSAAKSLPTPPETGSPSPSSIIITIEDDEDEEEDIPLSPRRKAQRRRSSRESERAKAVLRAQIDSAGEENPASKKSPSPQPKTSVSAKRSLRRGLRNQKASEEKDA